MGYSLNSQARDLGPRQQHQLTDSLNSQIPILDLRAGVIGFRTRETDRFTQVELIRPIYSVNSHEQVQDQTRASELERTLVAAPPGSG